MEIALIVLACFLMGSAGLVLLAHQCRKYNCLKTEHDELNQKVVFREGFVPGFGPYHVVTLDGGINWYDIGQSAEGTPIRGLAAHQVEEFITGEDWLAKVVAKWGKREIDKFWGVKLEV